ncbi:MAG: nucleoside transporter C-terminal domain-containing protein [Pseudomonadota bacterium]|nr:nucleoside transporter C-terminal domain-containing protein [Pseudomonadota bacterium]
MALAVQGLFGLAMFIAIAWACGENRRRLSWRIVGAGILIQFVLALLLIKLPPARLLFEWLGASVTALQNATRAGTSFVFGYLGGGPLPFEAVTPANAFVLAFQALPLILIISALTALLYYWRIVPGLVRVFSKVLERSMGICGASGIAAAANVFIGMIEAPLLIRPYLARLDRSDLFLVMSCGMATIAGTVLVLYAFILQNTIPDAAGHLLTASLMNAPAAIVMAKVMIPGPRVVDPEVAEIPRSGDESAMDAIARGTIEGAGLLINVIAMLVVLVALVHLANAAIGLVPDVAGAPLSLQRVLGWIMAPLVWLAGIPWSEAVTAGGLMGIKTVLNELLAYVELAALPPETLSERSRLIMSYAICGFANLGSLGILIGGLATIVPERRAEIAGLGMRSILAGTLATLSTGAVVGIVY